VNRILIVRLGALGDVVHAIPVAAALRRAFPTARIDWLVSAKHREILDLVPVIDRRLVISDRPSTGHGVKTNGTSLFAAIRELRKARYAISSAGAPRWWAWSGSTRASRVRTWRSAATA